MKPRRAVRFCGLGFSYDAVTRLENQQPRDRTHGACVARILGSNAKLVSTFDRCGQNAIFTIPPVDDFED